MSIQETDTDHCVRNLDSLFVEAADDLEPDTTVEAINEADLDCSADAVPDSPLRGASQSPRQFSDSSDLEDSPLRPSCRPPKRSLSPDHDLDVSPVPERPWKNDIFWVDSPTLAHSKTNTAAAHVIYGRRTVRGSRARTTRPRPAPPAQLPTGFQTLEFDDLDVPEADDIRFIAPTETVESDAVSTLIHQLKQQFASSEVDDAACMRIVRRFV